jgi:hypothetical protein
MRFDTTTGKILWNSASGSSVIDEPSIVDGVLYWVPATEISRLESEITKCMPLL